LSRTAQPKVRKTLRIFVTYSTPTVNAM